MGEQNILKGVFKDGAMIASVIQKDENAKIMLKGAEPSDAAFKDNLKRAADGCKPHVEKFAEREMVAVLLQDPAGAEKAALGQEELQMFGLTKLSLMDGNCGIPIRVVEAEPPPVPLAYTSLTSSTGLPDQPGLADIPAEFPRKTYKDLTDPQKKIFEAAAQVAGRGLVRIVCFDNQGLKMVVSVRDMPPTRARSVLIPIAAFADDLAKGTSFDDIVKRLGQLRA